MTKIFAGLMAIDGMAQKAGCGLKPELRQAMEASLRFPAKAASPASRAEDMVGALPEKIMRLEAQSISPTRRNVA